MAIIYTYPVKTNPVDDDLVLISDSADKNNTKQVKISSMRGATVSGVADVNIGTSSASTGAPLVSLPNSGNVIITSKAYNGTTNVGHVPAGGSATTFLRGDGSWVVPTDTIVSPSLPLNGVQYRNANGNFEAASSLIFESNNAKLIVGDQANDIYGIIEIQSDSDVGAELKIQGGGGFYTTIRGAQIDTASYNITLPVSGPGGNDKILQSDSSGNLSWIDTPSGSNSVSISADNSSTDYVDIQVTPNPITGTGSISADLSASGGGGAGSDKKFLGYDNTWKIPTSFGNITSSVDSKITGSRSNTDNAQTTNGIIELSNEATAVYGFQANIDSNNKTTGGSRHIIFRYNGGEIGFIRNASTNSVAYSTSASDERKKKNIVNWDEKVLEDFSLIEPKKFNYLNEQDSDGLTKGFIAQQMVDKFPEAYPKDPDTESQAGYYSFNPSGMTVYLMKAVKELKEEIDTLKSRISTLEG